ncbi:MAG: hypothetical protein R3C52_03545 [Hyphomonadaceae bacterium]
MRALDNAKRVGGASALDQARRALVFGAPAVLATSCMMARGGNAERTPQGKSTFVFDGWDGPPINVHTYAPARMTSATPFAFIMHGQGRNADEYRDQWADLAEAHGLAIAAPEFARKEFPGSNDYNLGRRFDAEGAPLPREQWSFSSIEPLFDEIRRRMGLSADRYGIYGHSAGAQFVHRFMLHIPEARVRHAISANAGWYTLPDPDVEAPFGLGGENMSDARIQTWLERPMTVLLGTGDIDTEQSSLNRTEMAMRQGPHRLARGRHFFEAGRARAEALNCTFRWRLAYAPNIPHDNSRMALHAVSFLVG